MPTMGKRVKGPDDKEYDEVKEGDQVLGYIPKGGGGMLSELPKAAAPMKGVERSKSETYYDREGRLQTLKANTAPTAVGGGLAAGAVKAAKPKPEAEETPEEKERKAKLKKVGASYQSKLLRNA